MIRSSVRDVVELCQYVTERDANARDAVESFRKIKWRQRRETERLAREDVDAEATITGSNSPRGRDDQHEQEPSPPTAGDEATRFKRSESDEGYDEQPVVRFDQFINEFVASDIDVLAIRRLPASPSDPHGAVSVPSRREGHSLTLCSTDPGPKLVVFGGRQLRDLTNLLPVAAKEIDPLKLERVRYVFSNAVYSYDLQTAKWELHQCTGKQPRERSDHSALFVAPHFLVVFGGRGRSGLIFNDLYVLSLTDWHWTEVDTRTRPSPRYWHGACLAGDEHLFVFAGKSDVQVHGDLQHIHIARVVELLQQKQAQQQREQGPEKRALPPDLLMVPLSWTKPVTVGKPPSARFGLRMVRVGYDRIAVIGGWRASHASFKPRAPRGVDVYVLDTMIMVWTKPQFSSHVCRLSAPPQRFLFECFYTQHSLVVFGGFTYATNGETESYSLRDDDRHVFYKLDLHRMIWRRHVVADAEEASLVTTAAPHFSSNAVMHGDDNLRVALTCVASNEQLPLELTALELRRRLQVALPGPGAAAQC